jgi:glycosyltransferase involved in cell wall biosynthesis
MRIMIVMDSLFTGGAEYSTLLWFEWLQANGYDAKLVLLKTKKPSYDLAQFQIERNKVRVLQQQGLLKRFQQLRLMIKDFKPHIVHSVLNASNFNCRIAKLTGGKFAHIESLVNQPYTTERLNDRSLSKWKLILYREFDRFTQQRGVQYFHANSNAVSDHYREVFKIPSDKISVITRGRNENVQIGKKEELRMRLNTEFKIPDNHLLLVTTGRHEHQKGQDVLLKAINLLKTTQPFTLLVAGREGAKTNELKQLIQSFDLEQTVRLIGHRTDVPQLLAAADVFVFPSRYEGMPGALIEACAAALPVVCTNLPCMTEVVQKDKNAFLFDLNNEVQLAACMDVLLENKLLRNQMGSFSIEIFRSKFQLAAVHEAMAAHYLKISSQAA